MAIKHLLLFILSVVSSALYAADDFSLYGKNFNPQSIKDDDHDGVINSRDVCPNTPLGALVTLQGCPEKSSSVFSMDMQILFKPNKSVVSPRFYGKIQQLANFLIDNPETKVRIEGHTDNAGEAKINQQLSQDRANAVSEILIDKFRIAPRRVTAVGYGNRKPIASNSTDEGKMKNRRVVAEVYSNQKRSLQKWTIYSVDQDIK
ncbi:MULTISPECIES: OmpA family protein [Marinomonas]|uniref:OmpA family protein n=1 Tax=Marinomonas TaxID=28253 RepID=UPI001056B802|nr:OmpA family protein [Marinomonas sp. KMM3893]